MQNCYSKNAIDCSKTYAIEYDLQNPGFLKVSWKQAGK